MDQKFEQIWTTESQREFIATASDRIAALEADNAELARQNANLIGKLARLNNDASILLAMHDDQTFICGKDDEPLVEDVINRLRRTLLEAKS